MGSKLRLGSPAPLWVSHGAYRWLARWAVEVASDACMGRDPEVLGVEGQQQARVGPPGRGPAALGNTLCKQEPQLQGRAWHTCSAPQQPATCLPPDRALPGLGVASGTARLFLPRSCSVAGVAWPAPQGVPGQSSKPHEETTPQPRGAAQDHPLWGLTWPTAAPLAGARGRAGPCLHSCASVHGAGSCPVPSANICRWCR